MPSLLLLALCLPPASAGGFAVSPEDAQAILQEFVERAHGRAFRHLGDERDFDHGHFLYAPGRATPSAVLYHTQELAYYYERRTYPDTPRWELFKDRDLPVSREHRTITAQMLDPGRLGFEVATASQWVFSRVECGERGQDPAKPRPVAAICLPDGSTACVAMRLPPETTRVSAALPTSSSAPAGRAPPPRGEARAPRADPPRASPLP